MYYIQIFWLKKERKKVVSIINKLIGRNQSNKIFAIKYFWCKWFVCIPHKLSQKTNMYIASIIKFVNLITKQKRFQFSKRLI